VGRSIPLIYGALGNKQANRQETMNEGKSKTKGRVLGTTQFHIGPKSQNTQQKGHKEGTDPMDPVQP